MREVVKTAVAMLTTAVIAAPQTLTDATLPGNMSSGFNTAMGWLEAACGIAFVAFLIWACVMATKHQHGDGFWGIAGVLVLAVIAGSAGFIINAIYHPSLGSLGI
jgi:hypothetical protein